MNIIETLNESFKELKLDDFSMYNFLYHGTYYDSKDDFTFDKISKIDLKKSKHRVDFGPGFYLTPDSKIAAKRAKKVSERKNEAIDNYSNTAQELGIPTNIVESQDEAEVVPIVLEYPFTLSSSESIENNIKVFPLPCNEWLEFIFNNRNNDPILDRIENHNKDSKFQLVYGYMADGLFQRVAKLLYKKFNDLSDKEVSRIYQVFTRKMKITEVQISLHSNSMISKVLQDGKVDYIE